jgi:hypothetical protein
MNAIKNIIKIQYIVFCFELTGAWAAVWQAD